MTNSTTLTATNSTSTILIAGVVATAMMTVMMLIAPYMGMPEMNIGAMLGSMLGMPAIVGWIMHFVIGIVFAYAYVRFFNAMLPIENDLVRAMVYGIIVFVFAQIMMFLMRAMGLMPEPDASASMALMLMGSLIGHLVYGLGLGFFVKK